MTNVEIGRRGESIAVEFLENKGYRVVALNFRAGRGEIDIIAWANEGCWFLWKSKPAPATVSADPKML